MVAIGLCFGGKITVSSIGGALDLVRLRTTVETPVRVYDSDGSCIALGTPVDGELKMTCLLQV